MDTFQKALAGYLDGAKVKEADMASKIGIHQASISRYRTGRRFPTAEVARLIDQHTGGAVAFAFWQHDFLIRAGVTK